MLEKLFMDDVNCEKLIRLGSGNKDWDGGSGNMDWDGCW